MWLGSIRHHVHIPHLFDITPIIFDSFHYLSQLLSTLPDHSGVQKAIEGPCWCSRTSPRARMEVNGDGEGTIGVLFDLPVSDGDRTVQAAIVFNN